MNNLWGGSVRGTTHRYRKCYKWVTVCAEEENRSIFRASIWHKVQQGLWSMGELETWLICSITTLILTLKLLQVIFFGPFSVGFSHFIFISIDKYFCKSLSLVNLSVKGTGCNFYFKASRTKLILHVCQSGRETRGSSLRILPSHPLHAEPKFSYSFSALLSLIHHIDTWSQWAEQFSHKTEMRLILNHMVFCV